MNNGIGQSILRTYTAPRNSFARAQFKYSSVAFSLSYVKVQNIWLHYVKFVCDLMATSRPLPPPSSASAVVRRHHTSSTVVVRRRRPPHRLPPSKSSAAIVVRRCYRRRHPSTPSSSATVRVIGRHRRLLPSSSSVTFVYCRQTIPRPNSPTILVF